jgi:hypothetical protein
MHTVCELPAFCRAAEQAGMSDDEISDLTDFLAENPEAGDEMAGTGGCRKVRVGGRGKGKSGGYRTITFFTGETMPVFLVTVFSKGEKASLSKKECNKLNELTKAITDTYCAKVKTVKAGKGGKT